MKKTIKLTESDLTRLVKQIINEQFQNYQTGEYQYTLLNDDFKDVTPGGEKAKLKITEKGHNYIMVHIPMVLELYPTEEDSTVFTHPNLKEIYKEPYIKIFPKK